MIYLISGQTRFDDSEITMCALDDCIDYFKDVDVIGLDFETQGFDPYTKNPITLQLGDRDNQFIIDCRTHDIRNIKNLLEDTSKLFLGHNLKFDLRFTLHKGIIMNNVYDTYIAEQILYNGFEYMRKSLDYVVDRYCGVMLDKSIRGDIHREGLTFKVLKYAADDVKYLEDVRNKQLERATHWNLHNAVNLNNLFVPVMAYLEYCGFKLDTKLWQEKIDIDVEQIKLIQNELNRYIIDNNIYKFINKQLDLFNPEPTASINWASPKQVTEFFQIIGVDTSTVDKETGEIKQSASADVLKKQLETHPIVGKYIRYRELLKRVSTYGANWFKFINPITGRIHTKYQQWMNTGRMSSGGKDKNSKIDYPNAQNIPSDKATRQCIIADKGNMLVNADYSGQETRVFADKTQEPALLKMYEEGFDDMHSYIAWHIFPEIQEKYPELTIDTLNHIKKEFPDKRQIAKFAGFSIQYGGAGSTIAANCNIPLELGEKTYKSYFDTFKGISSYFDRVYKEAKRKGYILFNDITNSKYFIPKALNDGKVKTRSYNFPIQGTSADMTKYAGILYWRSFIERNLVFKCKIAIICHDEYLIEVPNELAEQEAIILKQCMEEAGKKFCKTIPITADPVVTPYWTH